MRRVKLKEHGIYKLPDGRQFVVTVSGRDSYSLYPPQQWRNFGMAEYRIHADGKLLSRGTPTRWSIEDLTDTGKVVQPLQSYQSLVRNEG